LLVVDVIVELPEGVGVLLVGAAPGKRGSARPGMNLVDGEILEDELDLRIVGQEAAEGVVEVAADGAFEVGELDDGDGSILASRRPEFPISVGVAMVIWTSGPRAKARRR
jgi:hypothetical protein